MAEKPNRNVIVLSIHPQYAYAIMNGTKRVEFRKANIPDAISYVVIYATAPTRKVLGYFTVAQVVKEPPWKLWQCFGSLGLIDETTFFEYYADQEYGVAILIETVFELARPFPLGGSNNGFSGPQSFSYYSRKDWRNLKRRRIARIVGNSGSGVGSSDTGYRQPV